MTLWEVVMAVWMLTVASAGIFGGWYVGVESLRRAEDQAAALEAASLAAEHWLAGDPFPGAASAPGGGLRDGGGHAKWREQHRGVCAVWGYGSPDRGTGGGSRPGQLTCGPGDSPCWRRWWR
ncbi:MAG: hypothetical protein K6T81_06945 [Alicyclobacillus macrosporangiidus]|uniref:hypothetical protein n=1 Tax=Alicyclobacillus macrosporangiidus TaxID=392015 RepID=UPI0026EDE939|nr:hypothetical protein [Alicyclobacillus macrosporangiidus]MCL6598464.1 hypothetical protein [Alicyclobacillus macrosporangiidus]